MGIAQKLYENGKTVYAYMRLIVHILPLNSVKVEMKISETYGPKYYSLPKVKKVKGAIRSS